MVLPILSLLLFGKYEYRMWVLQGPPPFNLLGSGPRLLWLGAYLVLAGYGLIALSILSAARCSSWVHRPSGKLGSGRGCLGIVFQSRAAASAPRRAL